MCLVFFGGTIRHVNIFCQRDKRDRYYSKIFWKGQTGFGTIKSLSRRSLVSADQMFGPCLFGQWSFSPVFIRPIRFLGPVVSANEVSRPRGSSLLGFLTPRFGQSHFLTPQYLACGFLSSEPSRGWFSVFEVILSDAFWTSLRIRSMVFFSTNVFRIFVSPRGNLIWNKIEFPLFYGIISCGM